MTFVEAASAFEAAITVRRADQDDPVDGKSIMQMLMLAGTCGTEIEIAVDGPDEEKALSRLIDLVKAGFGEEE